MPQTREHLAICRLLGVQAGLVALTKSDLVESDWIELVKDDLTEFVKGTFLEGRPVIPVSSQTGQGLDDLRAAIQSISKETSSKSDEGIFRIPIDRVFTMRGFGAVVTGTLFSGSIRTGERVHLFPGTLEARIRGLQVHGKSVEEAIAGSRTAVNLQGVERMEIERGHVLGRPSELMEIERGHVLGRPSELKPTYMLDLFLEHIFDSPRPLKTRDRVRFHTGTSEVMGRVSLIGKDEIDPGESVYAQIRLEAPVAVLPRDRFVIRSYSPVITIGGGEILDVMPRKHRRLRSSSMDHLEKLRSADETERLLILIQDTGVSGADVEALTGRLTLTPDPIRNTLQSLGKKGVVRIVEAESGLSLTKTQFEYVQKAVTDVLTNYHRINPLRPGAPREEVRGKSGGASERVFGEAIKVLSNKKLIKEEGALLRLAAHEVQVGEELGKVKNKLENFFRSACFQPPVLKEVFTAAGTPNGSGKAALQVLVDEGTLIRLKDDLIYHQESLDEAKSKLESYLNEKDNISASEFRDLLGITRKHAIPLLEYFDTARVTLRVGDKRVLRRRRENA
jgi:selenocysteine-specific elongation factor